VCSSDLKAIGLETGFTKEVVDPLRDLYDGEILEADDALGRFLDWQKETGRFENSLIVITSDHGEAFGEHGVMGHGGVLFEERIHIPLLVHFPSPYKFPRLLLRGEVDTLMSQVDILPTILGYLGSPPGNRIVRGRNLAPSLSGKEPAPEGEVFMEELADGTAIRAARKNAWKLITAEGENGADGKGGDYLFHLGEDPAEDRNLSGLAEATRAEEGLRALIGARLKEARSFYSAKGDGAEVDPETKRRLEELGYGK